MHLKFSFSKTVDVYDYDHTSDCAIWAIALVHICLHMLLKWPIVMGFTLMPIL